jgi:peroxiredoxin
MKRLRVQIVVAACAVAFGAALSASTGATSKSAPDIALPRADGAVIQLSEYRGKVVLVDFWATWCPPCKASFPALDALYREYQSRGFEVLAVNVDERRADVEAFLKDHPHHMTVVFDPKGVSPAAFGVKGMPSSFVIDRGGQIRFTHMGYTGNVEQSYRQEINQLLAEQ